MTGDLLEEVQFILKCLWQEKTKVTGWHGQIWLYIVGFMYLLLVNYWGLAEWCRKMAVLVINYKLLRRVHQSSIYQIDISVVYVLIWSTAVYIIM